MFCLQRNDLEGIKKECTCNTCIAKELGEAVVPCHTVLQLINQGLCRILIRKFKEFSRTIQELS